MLEKEQLNIFDESRKHIGVATREDVHRFGYWHEVFHCWFVSKENGIDYLYLQLRSQTKKDYPNLLDITAAGHLLSNETVQDGVREIKEEIGIELAFEDLLSVGVIDYSVDRDELIDKEIANVFLYKSTFSMEDFTLQTEEVAGMVKTEFNDFTELWNGRKETIKISGFRMNEEGNRITIDEEVGKNSLVPHPVSFYQDVIEKIKEKL